MTTTPTTKSTSPCCGPTCCGGTPTAQAAPSVETDAAAEAIRAKVREGYSAIARAGSWNAANPAAGAASATLTPPAPASGCGCGPATGPAGTPAGGGCCGAAVLSPEQLSAALGYAAGEVAAIPESANMGLSCGNPTALATLKPGEVVLDLGSGGGFDCFIAGPKVGPTGRVIGIDMTPDMLAKARRNLATYRERTNLHNIEFRLGEIEHLPVADASVDVVISNCVLNLSPDKAQVWREIARVLRPGGRVAVSDLALLRPLPPAVRADVEALVGCIAGAELVETTRTQMAAAGLTGITLTAKPSYIDAMTSSGDPLYLKIVQSLPRGTTPADFITSLDISARKPA